MMVKQYKKKVCPLCGKEFQPASGSQLRCLECRMQGLQSIECKQRHLDCCHRYRLENPEKIKALACSYNAEHKDEIHGYYVANSEKAKARAHEFFVANREKETALSIAWTRAHPELRKVYATRCRKLHPGTLRKQEAKRRALGFIPLNQSFVGSDGHHIDAEQVIYIPHEMHESVSHNVWTGWNMAKINAIAYNFLFKQEVGAALEDKREQLA